VKVGQLFIVAELHVAQAREAPLPSPSPASGGIG
jgi:hypothetical protein